MKKQKKLKRDNRGFSLVELIIVIAIVAIIGGVAGFGISMVSGKPAEECARKLASAVSHGRTTTLGKYRNRIIVTKQMDGKLTVREYTTLVDSDGNLQENQLTYTSTVGSKGVKVEYQLSDGTVDELEEGWSLEIRYNSGTGAMKKMIGNVCHTEDIGGCTGRTVDNTTNGNYCVGFKVSKAGMTWLVKLEPLTGNITTKRDETTS